MGTSEIWNYPDVNSVAFLILTYPIKFLVHWLVSFLCLSILHSHILSLNKFFSVLINSVTEFYNWTLRKESQKPYDFRVYQSTIGQVQGFPGVCKMRPYCRRRQWKVGSWRAGGLIIKTAHEASTWVHRSSWCDETNIAWISYLQDN